MTNYTKAVDFAAKDSLTTGNSAKIVKGTEIDTEFNAISTAIATKSNIAGPTFTGTVTIPTATISTVIVPDASDGASIGSSSLEFSDIYLADGALIYLGDDQDTTLTHVADTGILLNSTRQLQFGDSGTYIHQSADGVLDLVADTEIEINATTIDINGAADVSGNLAVGGNLTVTGTATIAGNLTFGDAASDTVAFTADVASNLLPSADNSYDLGASGSEWKDLFLDGTAHIDTLDIDENATIAGTLAVTGVISPTTHIDMPDSANIKLGAADDLQMYHDGSHSYITNATGTMKIATETSGIAVTIGHTTSETTVADNLTVTGDTSIGGNLTVTGTTSFSGNQTFGNAASDTVTFSADIASDLLPSADGTHDLGASGAEWENLFIDGTANIDSLVADTADINGGTVDGAVIGGSSAAAGTFTDLTATGTSTYSTVDINGGAIDGTVIGANSAAAGTFAAITGTTGTFSSNVTISTADNTNTLTLTSTDADASGGPILNMYRNSVSAADSDVVGKIDFTGKNDAGSPEDVVYSRLFTKIIDASDGTEDGQLHINTMVGGSVTQRVTMSPTELIINDASADLDFRIESNDNANMLFVDAGNNRVLFGTTASRSMSGVTPDVFIEGTDFGSSSLGLVNNATGSDPVLFFGRSRGTSLGSNTALQADDRIGSIFFQGNDGTDLENGAASIQVFVDGTPGSNDMPGRIQFHTSADGGASNTERMRIDSSGDVSIPAGSLTITTADNNAQLILVSTDADASTGPNLLLKRDNNSAAGDDVTGTIVFQAEDAGNNLTDYIAFKTMIQDATGGSEDGRLKLELMSGGTARNILDISGSNAVVFNEDSQDIDFRVESDNLQYALFVDGGNDVVGIGTSVPANYHSNANNLVIYEAGNAGITIATGSSNYGSVFFGDGTSGSEAYTGYIQYGHDGVTSGYSDVMTIGTGATQRIGIGANGISFGAGTHTAARGLDDYEEGTYTVTGYDASSGGNASSTTITGTYTKIGRQVTVQFYSWNNISTSGMTSGNIFYFTLPFTGSAVRAIGSAAHHGFTYDGNTNMQDIKPLAAGSSGRGYFKTVGYGQADSTVKVSDITSGTDDIHTFTLTYTV